MRGGADIDELTAGQPYGTAAADQGHPGLQLSDFRVVVLAIVVAVSVWVGEPLIAAALALVAVLPFRSVVLIAVAIVLAAGGALRSDHAWNGLRPDQLGHFEGWVRLVDDPQPYPSSTRVIVDVDGERYEIWSRGRAQQLRVREWRGGQWISVSGRRTQLDAQRAGRVAWQHVVGEFDLDWASDVDEGGPIAVASNRVRRAIERAATALPDDDGALFRGLVVGDDRDQPRAMINRFRASGLSHLTAVSGQNVAFVLAACGPLLRRLRRWPRLGVTVGLILWFVALTRFEPSIVRAGTMASLSAVAYATGRERAPIRILALAVLGLVLVDPLLVWSIGFWLSVGATTGVITVGPALAKRFEALGPFALPLGITLGAQAGVMIPVTLVFGRLPLVSIPANLLAVPVAGAVMLYGLPAGLVAGWLPVTAPVLMAPARLGTRWVDTVALLGERLEPGGVWPWVGWSVVATVSAICVAVSVRRGKNQSLHGDPSPDR
ncbi:MAG: ComEC/Rec2 family competence protein [Ilumatobacter sp.]